MIEQMSSNSNNVDQNTIVNENIQQQQDNDDSQELESRIMHSLTSTKELFKHCPSQRYLLEDYHSTKIAISTKLQLDYPNAHLLVQEEKGTTVDDENNVTGKLVKQHLAERKKQQEQEASLSKKRKSSTALVLLDQEFNNKDRSDTSITKSLVPDQLNDATNFNNRALQMHEKRRRKEEAMKPQWHAPWKLMRVISGHNGWVRALAVDVSNEWFAVGASDRTIKIFDLASGRLKLTLTGHISTVRGLAISDRHPYLFSVSEDKTVRCWDLEQNKCVRQYHGHLSGVYCCTLHPTLDLLITGGRDSSARVWDIRTKAQIHLLTGHSDTVASVFAQAGEPQVVTGSADSTVRLWDLKAGKTRVTLTNHKKSIRSLALHPSEYSFASASADNIKKWKCPEGRFMQNFEGHNAIVDTLSVNNDNVMVSGGNDGSMCFWDWKTGYKFQELKTIAQPGSLDSEAAIYCSTFDRSGSRLLTGEGDKTVKVWREDETATEQTHPIDWKPNLKPKNY